jgi:hypothetical protein
MNWVIEWTAKAPNQVNLAGLAKNKMSQVEGCAKPA